MVDIARIKAGLSELQSDLEQARSAKNQIESDRAGAYVKAAGGYEYPEEALASILDRIHDVLVVLLDVAGLADTRDRLIKQWASFRKEGGIGKTTYLGQYDYLESKPFEYVSTLIDGLRLSVGDGMDPAQSYELAKLETLLRKTHVLVRRRNVMPRGENDIQQVMNDYLSAFFTEHKSNIVIGGIIRDFKPDCGIRNLGVAIEFKYAASKAEVSRAIGGIFEDISGYNGSADWTRFYSVIYQTEPFESEDRVRSELTRAGTITWKVFFVNDRGSRALRRKGAAKSPTKRRK